MKMKFLFILLTLSVLTANSVAQTITNRFEFGYADRAALSIPKEFSYNGVPYLMMYDNKASNTIKVYNEDLDVVKSITMKEDISFNYQLTYQDQVRDVVAVNEIDKNKFCEYESYNAFIERETSLNPNFKETDLIITDLGNGMRKISVNYSNEYIYGDNETYYSYYSYFGTKYPKVYYIDEGGKFVGYRVAYDVQYSDWRSAGTRVVECSKKQERIRLCNINLNQGDGKANSYFEVSQTLFNNDASFEYIIPKYKLSNNGNVSGYNQISYNNSSTEEIITKRSTVITEQKELALAGFQVVSDNGDVISDIEFDGGFEGQINIDHAFLITVGSNIYLAFDGYCNQENSTIFYKIDNTKSGIQKAKIAPSVMCVSPTIVDNGSIINVNFEDGNRQNSDITITSSAGAIVHRQRIPAGQTSTQLNANSPSGMYYISRIQNGEKKETKKIIIK